MFRPVNITPASSLTSGLDDDTARWAILNIAHILGSAEEWDSDTLDAIAEEVTAVATAAGWPSVGDQTLEELDVWRSIDWSA